MTTAYDELTTAASYLETDAQAFNSAHEVAGLPTAARKIIQAGEAKALANRALLLLWQADNPVAPPVVTPPAPPAPPAPTGGPTPPTGFTTLVDSDPLTGPLSSRWIPGMGDNFYGAWGQPPLKAPLTAAGGPGSYDAEYFDPTQLVPTTDGLQLEAVRDTSQSGYSWKSGAFRSATNPLGAGGVPMAVEFDAEFPDGVGCWGGIWGEIAAANPEGAESESDEIESGYGAGSKPTNMIEQITTHLNTSDPDSVAVNTGVDLSTRNTYRWAYYPGVRHDYFFNGKLVHTVPTTETKPYDLKLDLQMAQNSEGWHPVVDSTTPSPSVMTVANYRLWK